MALPRTQLGVIWEPGNTWADYACLLPGASFFDACKPAPSMTSVVDDGLDCAQSGWRGREAECHAANAADQQRMIEILRNDRNSAEYRDWYEMTGGANDPRIPPPSGINVPSWVWFAAAGVAAVVVFSKSR